MKEVTCARMVCTLRDIKKDKCRTRMKLGRNNIQYQKDDGTLTAHLKTDRLLFNKVLSSKILNL